MLFAKKRNESVSGCRTTKKTISYIVYDLMSEINTYSKTSATVITITRRIIGNCLNFTFLDDK